MRCWLTRECTFAPIAVTRRELIRDATFSVLDSLRWRGPPERSQVTGWQPLLQGHRQPTRCLRGGEIKPVLVDVGALRANIVEDRGKLGVDGSPDHVVVLALEVVTVCLYFSSPQIPLLNGPGLAPPAALRGRPKGNREGQVNNFMTRDSKRQAGATKGCEFYGSGYEPGLGDVDERCASLEGLERQPQTCSRTIFGGNYVDEIMRYL